MDPLIFPLWEGEGGGVSLGDLLAHSSLPDLPHTPRVSHQSVPGAAQLKEARHVPEDFAGRCIMKVSLRRCTEKPLCDVLFDILVERPE